MDSGYSSRLFNGCGSSDDFLFTNPNVGTVPTALSFQSVPQRTAENSLNTINVAIVDQNQNVVVSAGNPVTISLAETGAATLSGTRTKNAVNGVASFSDLSVDVVGSAPSAGIRPDSFGLRVLPSGLTRFLSGLGDRVDGAA